MNTENNQQLNPRAALDQARRVEDMVRRKGRWHGWAWLIVAVLTPLFLIGAGSEVFPRGTQFWIAIGFMVAGGTLAILETRRGVWSEEAARTDRPFTWAYMAAVGLVALVQIFGEFTGLPLWYIGLAALPSIPCLIVSWRIFSR